MGLRESLRGLLAKKTPSYQITNLTSWDDFTFLARSDNYLDQYFGWTYRALKLKSDILRSMPPKMYATRSKVKTPIDSRKNDLLHDLMWFNDHQTYAEARQITHIQLGLVGLAFWAIFDSDHPDHDYEFYLLDPQKIAASLDPATGLPVGYWFTDIKGQKHFIELEDIIVWREPNPKNWLEGHSPLQAARYAHNSDELAHKFNMNVFGNMGKPEGLLAVEGIGDDQRKLLEEQLQQKYGGVRNARKTGIVNFIPQWIPIGTSQKELDFVEGLKLMRDEILSMYGVPKPLVGLTDSTYTNSEEAQRIFQRYTIKPALDIESDVLNQQLVPKYYQTDRMTELFYFEFDDPVDQDTKLDAEVATTSYAGGLLTLNEAREILGYEEVDGGEEFHTEPVPQVVETPPAKPEPTKALSDVVTRVKQNTEMRNKAAEMRAELKSFFATKNRKAEERMTKRTQEYFADQLKRILSGTKGFKSPNMNIDISVGEEADVAVKFFHDMFMQFAEEFNTMANDLVGHDEALSEHAIEQVEENLKYFAKEINETTRGDLQQLVAEAVRENLGLEELRKSIGDLFDRYSNGGEGITQTRAETIARSEVNPIKNLVARSNYAQNDAVKKFEWLTAEDNDVRDAHEKADGATVFKGTKFSVGGEYLEYPGDRNGSAGNTINCRCTILPVVE